MVDTPGRTPSDLAAAAAAASRRRIELPGATVGFTPLQHPGPSASSPGEQPARLKRENLEATPDSLNHGPEQATFDAQKAAREDHDIIVAGLGRIAELLQKLGENIDQQVAPREQQRLVIEQLLSAVEQLRLLVDELVKNGTDQSPGLGYATSQQAMVIDTETTDACKRWPSSAWEKIKDEIKKVLRRLWSMISKLITVKEWTLAGKVGTGALLGLAEASISVTFGQ